MGVGQGEVPIDFRVVLDVDRFTHLQGDVALAAMLQGAFRLDTGGESSLQQTFDYLIHHLILGEGSLFGDPYVEWVAVV